MSAAGMPGSADDRLVALYSDEWAWRQTVLPDAEDSQRPIAPYLPDVSPAGQDLRLRRWEGTLLALDQIPRDSLSSGRQVDFDVYRAQLRSLVALQRFHQEEMPFNSDTSFWMELTYTARREFRRAEDYSNWVEQLRCIPAYVRQQMVAMRQGLARGFTPPQVSLEGRAQSLQALVDRAPEETALYEPFTKPSVARMAALAPGLAYEARALIQETVQPALAELYRFVTEEYIPSCRTTIAARDLPDGEAYYDSLIRVNTTLELDAERIHEIGLAEVAQLEDQMREVASANSLGEDWPTVRASLDALPNSRAGSPQELLAQAAWIAKVVDGALDRFFDRLPRARFTIRPVPDEIAPFYTSGRGGPGVYLVNTYRLEQRPLYNLAALTLHEADPGHAFQMALALEQRELADFRRHTYLSAFGEGWALYCEWLGQEMAVYRGPTDVLGMLGYQSWRAARLVVDTGIHAMGWSRARAIEYLREHSLLPDQEITTEVDRYISWPAQALAYYLGEMKIRQLRQRAERSLGSAFDLRSFHDTVLDGGCVPLDVLQNVIDTFIENQGRRAHDRPAGSNL
jgi:uncharacterized protein (DUF885 family)